jgi:hypothetical protein
MIEEAVDEDSKAAGVNNNGNVFGESEHSSPVSSSSSDVDVDELDVESNDEEIPAAEFDDDELCEEILVAFIFLS